MMHRKIGFCIFFSLLAFLMLNADCQGCMKAKDCSAYDNNKAQCNKMDECSFDDASYKCVSKASSLTGCLGIINEEACNKAPNCFYDPNVKTCVDAPAKADCGTITNEVACKEDKNCHWDEEKNSCHMN